MREDEDSVIAVSESDVKADALTMENEYISVTPLLKSFFSKDLYERIKKDKNL